MITVRPARPAEYGDIGELTFAAYTTLGVDVGGYATELRNAADRAERAQLLVAVDEDERILGAVTYVPGLGPYAEFDDADAAGFRMLAVAPAARGRGVGAALVRACVQRARADRRARLVLHTTQWMTAAHRLYAREGFRRAPARDWEPEAGVLLMGYELNLRDAT
jgi:GNAT superfamily N-acetyltransferase